MGRQNRSLETGQPIDEVSAARFEDSVGEASDLIDLHPSSAGDNYIGSASLPFQIPFGALLPVQMQNLLPACKNIGTTHVTNGCYRSHPVEWGVGEAIGCLADFAITHTESVHRAANRASMHGVHPNESSLAVFPAPDSPMTGVPPLARKLPLHSRRNDPLSTGIRGAEPCHPIRESWAIPATNWSRSIAN
ncbi:FAD-dependent oxidoreductase [Stieleria sp. ICT_E10.1]|nr:FAD-dependent oxidoreductase [Stieleria sedimenti]